MSTQRWTLSVLLVLALLALGASAPTPAHAGGVVAVCDETHLLAALAGGGTVTFACSGTIVLTNTITIYADTAIDGSGQEVTISGNNTVPVMTLSTETSLLLERLTIADGNGNVASGGIHNFYGTLTVDYCNFVGNQGGAIYSNHGTTTVSNCAFSGNDAGRGGGIYSYGNGTVTVRNSSFTSNSGGISNYRGTLTVSDTTFGENRAGGIYNDRGTVIVTESSFTSNSASSGGGIFNDDRGILYVNNSIFSHNLANYGGAIYNDYWGTLDLNNSTFLGNRSANYGGAIFNEYAGIAMISDSTFTNNSAHFGGGGIANNGTLEARVIVFSNNSASNGGGIHNANNRWATVNNSTFSGNSSISGGGIANNGMLDLDNSTFSGNSASNGGGIYNDYDGMLQLSNSTFFGNSATSQGGGILNAYTSPITVTNSTFRGNSASSGGGIAATQAEAMLRNTIVVDNLTGGNCFGVITDGGGNLSYPDATCPGINADPLLGSLQDNGGPTWTMALGEGSAAIDAGDDAICAAPPVNNLDQRGVTRPQGLHCDIGAVEQIIEPTAVGLSALSAQSRPGALAPVLVAGILLLALAGGGRRRRHAAF